MHRQLIIEVEVGGLGGTSKAGTHVTPPPVRDALSFGRFISFRFFVPDIQVTSPTGTPLSHFEVASLIGLEFRVMDQVSVDRDLRMVIIDSSATGPDDTVPRSGAGSIPAPGVFAIVIVLLNAVIARGRG